MEWAGQELVWGGEREQDGSAGGVTVLIWQVRQLRATRFTQPMSRGAGLHRQPADPKAPLLSSPALPTCVLWS